jgi:hypothetical protein
MNTVLMLVLFSTIFSQGDITIPDVSMHEVDTVQHKEIVVTETKSEEITITPVVVDTPSQIVPVITSVTPDLTIIDKSLTNYTVKQKDSIAKFVINKRTKRLINKSPNDKLWEDWKEVYSKDYKAIKHIAFNEVEKLKIIAEVSNWDNEVEKENGINELKYFKTLGYNTVLFIWKGVNIDKTVNQIGIIKNLGYKVFFTYGNTQDIEKKVYIDPSILKQGLIIISGISDGFIVGWNRTGLHLFTPDKKYIEFVLDCVRSGNDKIPIFGECYFGYTNGEEALVRSKLNTGFHLNFVANMSGVVCTGYLWKSEPIRLKMDINRMLKVSVPKIILVVGEKPFYLKQNKNNKTKQQNREIINGLEEKFRKQNFGTITVAGDGSGGLYDKKITDDVKDSNWSK